MPGYWGEITSSVDWCEDNYVYSSYIAEWWNSWSNVPIMFLAAAALVASRRRINTTQMTWFRFFVGYIILFSVFVGSFSFHATLKYTGQLLDELPMIYGALSLHHAVSTTAQREFLTKYLIAIGVAITWLMIQYRESPLPLQLSYGLLVAVLIIRSIKMSWTIRPLWDASLLSAGFAMYITGFSLWLLDQHFCSTVKFYYFHAWWHLLAGTGTYIWIQFSVARNVCETESAFEDVGLLKEFDLPFGDTLPFIVPVEKS